MVVRRWSQLALVLGLLWAPVVGCSGDGGLPTPPVTAPAQAHAAALVVDVVIPKAAAGRARGAVGLRVPPATELGASPGLRWLDEELGVRWILAEQTAIPAPDPKVTLPWPATAVSSAPRLGFRGLPSLHMLQTVPLDPFLPQLKATVAQAAEHGVQLGSREFPTPQDARVLAWLQTTLDGIAESHPGSQVLAWIHTTCSLGDEAGGYVYHLPLQSPAAFGAWVRTTMVHDLDHPAPVCDCASFAQQHGFLDASKGKQLLVGEARCRAPMAMLTRARPGTLTSYPFGHLGQASTARSWHRREQQMQASSDEVGGDEAGATTLIKSVVGLQQRDPTLSSLPVSVGSAPTVLL